VVSNKKSVARLIKISKLKGIEHVVFSPGSRNAPLMISFNEDSHFTCLSITDERSAAFFALGLAKQSKKPVIISCTSGSAALNYAPAIAEAYHQKIPLIILSADRAKEWVDQGDGQTINQTDVYKNYIKASFEIIQETEHEDELKHNDRLINEAINISLAALPGPVHINFPFREPIYDTVKDYRPEVKIINNVPALNVLGLNTIAELKEIWLSSKKRMLICGLLEKEDHLSSSLNSLIKNHKLSVLSESTSNLILENDIPTIDRVIDGLSDSERKSYSPELVITIGGAIVSKKIKSLLRTYRPKFHWHISEGNNHPDVFQALTHVIPLKPIVFFTEINKWKSDSDSDYFNLWQKRKERISKNHEKFINKVDWSDLLAYKIISSHIPTDSNVHLANSTSIRYMQLFEHQGNSNHYANRGVSGIDGCTSTAIGYSYLSKEQNILITGDLAFFYDSNAFWNKYIETGLKIIVVNNSGGGIFRIISGPSSTKQLDEFFEATQTRSAQSLAQAYNLKYESANDERSLEEILPTFLSNNEKSISILEINTPREVNDKVLKSYFNHINE